MKAEGGIEDYGSSKKLEGVNLDVELGSSDIRRLRVRHEQLAELWLAC